MSSDLPIREHDYVWLTEEGVCGKQLPKGTMLWILRLFDIKDGEGSLEIGPPGKYAECRWGNKIIYVSLDKLTAIQPGQWVKFDLEEYTYTGKISKVPYPVQITHLKPSINGLYRIEFIEIGPFMSLIDEKERADVV